MFSHISIPLPVLHRALPEESIEGAAQPLIVPANAENPPKWRIARKDCRYERGYKRTIVRSRSGLIRSEENTSVLQSLMRNFDAVSYLIQKITHTALSAHEHVESNPPH